MTTLQQLTDGQASAEVVVNENFETLSAAGIFGKRQSATSGLTWGYYGGLYNGHTIANGTVTLTDDDETYIVVARATGVVSASTSTTNWENATDYARVYKVTAADGAVVTVVDARMDTGGLLLAVPAADPGGGGGGSGDLSAEELEYWGIQAALLDPAAYVHELGASFSFTVPSGEQWFLLNAWNARMGGAGADFFMRDPGQPMPMAEGFNLQGNGTANAFAYYCKPSLVVGGYTDPKALYYERLARLRVLMLNQISLTTSAGASSSPITPFPSDFDGGLIVGVNGHDVSWVALADATHGLLNLANEVSDLHQNRIGIALKLPFDRTTFTHMKTQSASVAGTSGSELAGNASLLYYKLPSDW